MSKKKKSKKQRDIKTVASVKKIMARPRFAESARREDEKEEQEAAHRFAKHHSFLNT